MSESAGDKQLNRVAVFRQDRRAMSLLRAKFGREPWRQLEVAEWQETGTGRWSRFKPRAWLVLAELLGGLVPISKEEADRLRDRRSAAGRRAAETARRADDRAAASVGALPGSSLGRAVRRGRIDPDRARLLAFCAQLRHEHSDYDHLLAAGLAREDSRSAMQPVAAPATWPEYLACYGFTGPVAEAMAGILVDPRQAHPRWFFEAILAVERALRKGTLRDLSGLSYEVISDCIVHWRVKREFDSDD